MYSVYQIFYGKMKHQREETYRSRYAVHLLRWAKINEAIPEHYTNIALDRLRQRGVLGVTKCQLRGVKNDGNMPENGLVMDVFEEIAAQYHPERIRSEKDARRFLRTWEQRPGRKVKAAAMAAA